MKFAMDFYLFSFFGFLTSWVHYIAEALLLVMLVALYRRKEYLLGQIDRRTLTNAEQEKLLASWRPEPLIPSGFVAPKHITDPFVVSNIKAKTITFFYNSKSLTCLNLATYNFYGFVGDEELAQRTAEIIKVCGVGSCGPRDFLGTNELHLKLEQKIAEFLGVERVLSVSYGFVTMASAIPAYARVTDIIFCDETANMSIQLGIRYSKATVYWYKRNDLDDLERVIISVFSKLEQNSREFRSTKCFIVAEAVSAKYSDLLDLIRMLELRKKYHIRLFVDETLSFGLLGRTGRGISEHFGVDVTQIDLIVAVLEAAASTMGGFCGGSKYMIDRQRLTSSGYIFSASQPPFHAFTGIEAVNRIMQNPDQLVGTLAQRSELFYATLVNNLPLNYVVDGAPPVAVFHIRKLNHSTDGYVDISYFSRVQLTLIEKHNIATVCSRYLTEKEFCSTIPSLRVAVNSLLENDEIVRCAKAICETLSACDCVAKIV